MNPVSWRLEGKDGMARAGVLLTPHGEVATPGFMPVGTRAAVRAVDVDDLRRVGANLLLANNYHLVLRPGVEEVAKAGGLHSFWGWEGPILTDSGGFQIFSLDPQVTEEGASFRSVYDGSRLTMSPEEAVRSQEILGSDIAMVLDVCLGLPAERAKVASAMERTLRWAERSQGAHRHSDQALFGIVQGGVDLDLRAESALRTAALGFPGFGIGGLSVGESLSERNQALEVTAAELPADRVRYLMGVGDPPGLLDAIERGCDLFDCVWPTRLARHGRALTPGGHLNLRRAEYRADFEPIDSECACHTCSTHHRSYLRHLLVTEELGAHRLLSIHNLTYTFRLLLHARQAIMAGRFAEFRSRWFARDR